LGQGSVDFRFDWTQNYSSPLPFNPGRNFSSDVIIAWSTLGALVQRHLRLHLFLPRNGRTSAPGLAGFLLGQACDVIENYGDPVSKAVLVILVELYIYRVATYNEDRA